jgi:hypothetical protein
VSDDWYDHGYAEQLEREADHDHEVAIARGFVAGTNAGRAEAMNDAERDDEEHARRQRNR